MDATENDIDEAEDKITSLQQPAGLTAVRYPEALWQKKLRCDMVYNKPRLKRTGLGPTFLYSLLRACLLWSTQESYTL